MRTSIVLAAGLVLIAAIIGATLARSPPTLAGTNSIPAETLVGVAEHPVGACQAGETVPAGTAAIRLSMSSIVGARVSVRALSGARLITSGSRGAGWTSSEVTVAVAPVVRGVSGATICFGLGDFNGEVEVRGEHTRPAVAAVSNTGQRLRGRFRVEYVRAGHASWLSLVSSIARHMSVGRGGGGLWIVFFTLALALSVMAITGWAVVRELR